MKLRYWLDFNKRQNSTKRPDLTKGTEIDVYIKDDCSLENPVFVVSDNLKTWSYCYAPSLGRYYFITDIVTVDSWQFEVHCTLDAAATYRDSIFAYTAFVERAASAYDPLVNDHLLSTQQTWSTFSRSSYDIGFGTGVYIIPVQGATGIQYVLFDQITEAAIFYNGFTYESAIGGQTIRLSDLLNDADAWKAAFRGAGYSFYNPTDYMGDMMFFPIRPTSGQWGTALLHLGIWKSGSTVSMLAVDPRAGWKRQISVDFPSSGYSDFRAYNSDFSQYFLYLPAVGVVQIPSIHAARGNLQIDLCVDWCTGAGQYMISDKSGNMITSYSAQIGLKVPYGKSEGLNSARVITAAIGGAQNIAGSAGGGAASAANIGLGLERMAIDTVRTAFDSCPAILGGNGAIATYLQYPNVIAVTRAVGSKEFPITECGRPLCQNVTLGNLSGYVQCGNASVPLIALDHVRSEINNMLNSGIYIE